MNYLKTVFWDYPRFTDEETLMTCLKEKSRSSLYFWIMKRFLEHGRVVDVLTYFKIDEIAEYLPKLRLDSYNLKKWKRLIEIYGNH